MLEFQARKQNKSCIGITWRDLIMEAEVFDRSAELSIVTGFNCEPEKVLVCAFYTRFGSVYLRVIFNLSYTLLGSVYLRVIFNLFYTLLGSVYLRVTFNLFYILLGSIYLGLLSISSIPFWLVYN